jgi:hypothetical protein
MLTLLLLCSLSLLLPRLPRLWPLLLLGVGGVALAQEAAPLPAGLAAYAPLLTSAIGLASAALVRPLTALYKHWRGTSGPTTVLISAVLSLLVSAGFTLWQAAATHTGPGLWPALLSAAMAFVVANGTYLAQVSAAAKGAKASPTTVVVTAVPQVLHPVGTPGTQPLQDRNGMVVGAVTPRTSGDEVRK